MTPERIAKTRAQAIACANAVHECRVILAAAAVGEKGSVDRKAYALEMEFWRLAERYEAEKGKT